LAKLRQVLIHRLQLSILICKSLDSLFKQSRSLNKKLGLVFVDLSGASRLGKFGLQPPNKLILDRVTSNACIE
jgi:hypothetical protein